VFRQNYYCKVSDLGSNIVLMIADFFDLKNTLNIFEFFFSAKVGVENTVPHPDENSTEGLNCIGGGSVNSSQFNDVAKLNCCSCLSQI